MINLGFQAGFSLYLQIWMCLDCSCPAYLKLLVTCAVLLWEMRSECLSSFQPFKSLAPCFSWCISLSASLWKKSADLFSAAVSKLYLFISLVEYFQPFHAIDQIRAWANIHAGCRQPPLQLFHFDRTEEWGKNLFPIAQMKATLLWQGIQLKFTSIFKK